MRVSGSGWQGIFWGVVSAVTILALFVVGGEEASGRHESVLQVAASFFLVGGASLLLSRFLWVVFLGMVGDVTRAIVDAIRDGRVR